MNRTILAVCVISLALTVIVSNMQVSDSVLYNKLIITVNAEKDSIIEGSYPVILGTVKDQGYKPVANVNVHIAFGKTIVTTTSDDKGTFKYKSGTPFTPGIYEIDVTITKSGYMKGFASSIFTVKPNVSTTVSTNLITGLPIQAGNYTVFLGKVTQWNLETTCFVSFSDKYMRFLRTCDLYNLANEDFKTAEHVTTSVSVLQYNDTYRLFSKKVYFDAFSMDNSTLKKFAAYTWTSYTP